jgi:integrase
MMSAYLPPNRTVPKISVPVSDRVWKMRSTGTRDPLTIKRMHLMIDELGRFGAGAWDLLGKLAQAKSPQHPDAWTLMDLYERWVRHGGKIEAMRAELSAAEAAEERERLDPLLDTLFDEFCDWIVDVKKRSQDTADAYARHLATLEVAGILRPSDLTVAHLGDWLDSLAAIDEKGESLATGTRRKYAMGVSAFCSWLVRKKHLLTANPMRDVEKPAAGEGRMQWISEAQMIKLADAQPSPYRELSAFIHGTGLDVSVACDLITAGDIDPETWSFASVRPKSKHRHTVVIAEWARPYVKRLLRGKLPLALLGEGVHRWGLSDSHRETCKKLKLTNYWLRDARHSWAVRFDDLGGSPADGAEQLGQQDNGVLFQRLYSKRSRSIAERQRIEAGLGPRSEMRSEKRSDDAVSR